MPAKKTVLIAIGFFPDELIKSLQSEFQGTYDFVKTDSSDLSLASKADVILTFEANEQFISEAKDCKWIHVLSAGVEDFLELDVVKNNDKLTLTNSSGIHAVPISEHIFALILAFTRGIRGMVDKRSEKDWAGMRGAMMFSRRELARKTMLIVGLGSIGLMTAKKAKAFGMKTVGIKRDPQKAPKDPEYSTYVDEVYGSSELSSAVTNSDVIVDTLPMTSETKGIFDSSIFEKVKRGVIFVNIGRGGTVVEKDLIESLKSGQISCAGLDVFEEEPLPSNSPFWNMDNVIVSPHISGSREFYLEAGLEIFKDNLRSFSEEKELRNVVNKTAGY